MRVLLTACATTALVLAGPLAANAAGQGPIRGSVGGVRLTKEPTVVADGATPPAVHASAWVIADLDTGAVLAAKAPHAQLRPASTLKTLTALVLLPRLNKADKVIGTDQDAGIIGSKVGVYPGLRYSVDQLFQGMFLASGNDAVHALAAHDVGGVTATVQRMNAKATEIGALDTHVTDPTGLDANGQYSSAYDLALFARAGLGRPDFSKYASTKYASFPLAKSGSYQVANQNKLLFNYAGALGVKTGYTTLARNTFIGAAKRGGHTLVVTLMNSPHGVTEDASTLLTWGFKYHDALRPVGTLVKPSQGDRTHSTPEVKKGSAGTSMPKHSKTVLAPGQAVQAIALRMPVWTYAAPAFLLLSLFLRRPKALRDRARNRISRARRH
jgi:serine-type D-Ala-D-Ala carboxypeptidase (penicillin-binding protein 5/6)